jgi:hypothetical protein
VLVLVRSMHRAQRAAPPPTPAAPPPAPAPAAPPP